MSVLNGSCSTLLVLLLLFLECPVPLTDAEELLFVRRPLPLFEVFVDEDIGVHSAGLSVIFASMLFGGGHVSGLIGCHFLDK